MGHNLQNMLMLELVSSLNYLPFFTSIWKCDTAFDGEVEAICIVLKQLTCLLWKNCAPVWLKGCNPIPSVLFKLLNEIRFLNVKSWYIFWGPSRNVFCSGFLAIAIYMAMIRQIFLPNRVLCWYPIKIKRPLSTLQNSLWNWHTKMNF